ncbi:UNVERIFIED_ORG: Choline dehydrogenase and related flavoproteins [Gordonia westfalica J30]
MRPGRNLATSATTNRAVHGTVPTRHPAPPELSSSHDVRFVERPSPHPSAASRDTADVIVVGSGFGGAVAALRLAEQGRRVLVLEQGRRHTPEDLLAARSDPRKYLWMPELGLRGFFWQRVLRHV